MERFQHSQYYYYTGVIRHEIETSIYEYNQLEQNNGVASKAAIRI